MKILAINGSHRGEAGNTQWLLGKVAEGAMAAGAEFETLMLADRKIIPCAGCSKCQTPEQLNHCIYEDEDDVKDIFEKMRAADILIYATPVYVFNISGLMKTFMDRMNSTVGGGGLKVTNSGLFFIQTDREFHQKPFAVLTCCGNVEDETTKNVVSYFTTVAKFLDAPMVGMLVRKSVGTMEESRGKAEGELKPAVREVLDAYVQAGRELATQGRIAAGTEKKANQNLLGIPFFDTLMKFRFFKEMAVKKAGQNG
jgi:multimeric flavodoxin WrbA